MPRPGRAHDPDRAARRGLSARQRLAVIGALAIALLLSLGGAAAAGAFGGTVVASVASPAAAPSHSAGEPAETGRTSCGAVAHIGDSTSVGMTSRVWLPDAAQRLRDQYRDVGVRRALIDASGGRSIVEELPGQVNGYGVASAWYREGFRGCWVFALGTNDIANIAVGSTVGAQARISEMMAAAHGEPVLWVNTQTDLATGPWSERNMQRWNSALVAACQSHPNMRIFDWASLIRPSWHLPDGIHYTSAGYAIRAHDIARALARAFPADGRSPACVVR